MYGTQCSFATYRGGWGVWQILVKIYFCPKFKFTKFTVYRISKIFRGWISIRRGDKNVSPADLVWSRMDWDQYRLNWVSAVPLFSIADDSQNPPSALVLYEFWMTVHRGVLLWILDYLVIFFYEFWMNVLDVLLWILDECTWWCSFMNFWWLYFVVFFYEF